jgi:hypothetical protein
MTRTRSDISRIAPRRRARLVLLLGLFALALGACSKCDVPNLLPHHAGPQTCHDGPSPS